jgi:plastocyanin
LLIRKEGSMLQNPVFKDRSNRFVFFVATVLFLSSLIPAITHTIIFGGPAGPAYAPKELVVYVGDTVKWVGDLNSNPLKSTDVPEGANPWQAVSGTEYIYPVKDVGIYHYQCDALADFGMKGVFEARENQYFDDIGGENATALSLQTIFPNPSFQSDFTIVFSNPSRQTVKLNVFDVRGKRVASLINGQKKEGRYQVKVDTHSLVSGEYICMLTGSSSSSRRSIHYVK